MAALEKGGLRTPYDTRLAERVRTALPGEMREQRMFGGLAFLLDDRLVVCVSCGGGDLLARARPERDGELSAAPGARRGATGKGRPMGPGWIAADPAAVERDDDLRRWIGLALDFHAAGSTASGH